MPQSAVFLREVVEVCKFAAPMLTIPVLLLPLFLKSQPKPLPRSVPGAIAIVLVLCCALAYSAWTGSCVLGGFIEGQAICGFTTKSHVQLHPVNDYWSLQLWYAFLFAFAGFFVLASVAWLIPGAATPWQRIVFIFTLGRSEKLR